MDPEDDDPKLKIYLPSQDSGVDSTEYLNRYIKREFPTQDGAARVYSIPRVLQKSGEKQASLAEEEIFNKLTQFGRNDKFRGLWMLFFHSTSYAGHSFRNQRVGKLMIREHDFVVFVTFKGGHFVVLVEVKSTNDNNTRINLEKISDAKIIKNNKRSAQHQLRDHLEILQNILGEKPLQKGIQNYIMWPFLSPNTRDPKQQVTKRWKEDHNLHVFEDTISDQLKFDDWFFDNVLSGANVDEGTFFKLLNRFIILGCGTFVDEIDRGLMALLTQEQMELLNADVERREKMLVVHGAAGTGKTMLVLRKLQQLYQDGKLNEQNRALYICYWPGIRYDMEMKMEALGIRKYVDTIRFFISLSDFSKNNKNSYKHVFMDEAEAIFLALDGAIIRNTLNAIYRYYHDGNCNLKSCPDAIVHSSDNILEKIHTHDGTNWGELWFMVDINQASLFLPKPSPQILKTPSLILTKVMRSTGFIFGVFKQFYSVPMPLLPKKILQNVNIPEITIGHHVCGPPVYWVNSENNIDKVLARVIIDLCSSKGIKAHDLCVIPFLVNEKLIPETINKYINEEFVENSFRPNAVHDVEHFLKHKEINNFLITWALRVKGLEFKVVIMAFDGDDFDYKNAEDRKKAYIMASRCTSLLIVVSNEKVKDDLDLDRCFQKYPFCTNL
ncbi:uncharacterized protein LOC123010340 isoform X2 [Tribolium madens]|nr:uncharacterized protein LOC123010340 isoform X2 [Tribolium madens]